MKKLGKLVISPEKVMKNEELINLQGGYSGTCAWICRDNGEYGDCNVQQVEAEFMARGCGGNWCCESCHEATWYASLCG